jgi:hypothetical protein
MRRQRVGIVGVRVAATTVTVHRVSRAVEIDQRIWMGQETRQAARRVRRTAAIATTSRAEAGGDCRVDLDLGARRRDGAAESGDLVRRTSGAPHTHAGAREHR